MVTRSLATLLRCRWIQPQTQVQEWYDGGAALLQPHSAICRPLQGLLDTEKIKGLAHITGGGLVDNIPRILPEGTAVQIDKGTGPCCPYSH